MTTTFVATPSATSLDVDRHVDPAPYLAEAAAWLGQLDVSTRPHR